MAYALDAHEQYVWWDRSDSLHVALVVGERDHLIHHEFPDAAGRGHQLDHACHCDPQLAEADDRQEVWRHHRV